jgi:hypothetical protein
METQELEKRFTYHKLDVEQNNHCADIRQKAHELAILIDGLCPDSREKSVAITKLEEVVFWANAAIARHE